ncbi:DUF2860 family protein [Thaumasiovibrio sp. DFM-14]|uniref:DUF2860 family protein n=1 Tax=Thaumasiovibrio sp. DFM-14 TaxID=3384792 RepID=UPI00399F7AFF
MRLTVMISAALAIVLSQTCLAKAPTSAGISGDIGLSALYLQSRSQFNTEESTTEDLTSSGKQNDKLAVYPLGNINYTFSDKRNQLYFGTSRADVALGNFHLELGLRHWTATNTEYSIGFIPGVLKNETWSDPYLVQQPRTKTDTNTWAVRFQAKNIQTLPLSLEVAAGKLRIDSEQSGHSNIRPLDTSVLDRNAQLYYGKLTYSHVFGRQLIALTSVDYLRNDADGSAMAFHQFGVEGSLILNQRSSSLITTLGYDRANHDALNPIFHQKQNDDTLRLFFAYEYRNPFNWESWSIVSLLGYQDTKSNIRFYDKDSLLISLGMNYRY